MTARAVQAGHPAAAGTLLAIWAAGSAAGGLTYGARNWSGTVARQLAVLLLLFAAGFAALAAARTLPPLYPLIFLAGLSCSPAAALITSFSQASRSAGGAEHFAWLASCNNLGGSVGYAAAGLLVAHSSVTTTILAGAALPALAAAQTAWQAAYRKEHSRNKQQRGRSQ